MASNSPGGKTSRRPPSRRTRSCQPPRTSPRSPPAGWRSNAESPPPRAGRRAQRAGYDAVPHHRSAATAVGRGDRVKFPPRQRDLRDFEPRAGADLRRAAEAPRQTAEHLKRSSWRSRRPGWAPGTDARGRGARTGRCGGRRFFSRGSKIFSARCIRSRPGRRPLGSLRSIPRRGAIQRPPIPAKWRPRSAPATIAGKNIRIGSIATADGADGLPQGCGDEGHALSLRTGANQPAGAMAGPRARRAGHADVSVPGPAGGAGARTDRHPFRSEKPTTKNACARQPRCRPPAAASARRAEARPGRRVRSRREG